MNITKDKKVKKVEDLMSFNEQVFDIMGKASEVLDNLNTGYFEIVRDFPCRLITKPGQTKPILDIFLENNLNGEQEKLKQENFNESITLRYYIPFHKNLLYNYKNAIVYEENGKPVTMDRCVIKLQNIDITATIETSFDIIELEKQYKTECRNDLIKFLTKPKCNYVFFRFFIHQMPTDTKQEIYFAPNEGFYNIVKEIPKNDKLISFMINEELLN